MNKARQTKKYVDIIIYPTESSGWIRGRNKIRYCAMGAACASRKYVCAGNFLKRNILFRWTGFSR